MEVIELSAGIYPAPKCISDWYKELPKRKDGQLDKRNQGSKEFNAYVSQMEHLSIQAMQNNVPFRLMSKSEWWI